MRSGKKKRWYDYLWVWATVYFAQGFFNILFARLGMINFLVPLLIALFGGGKALCSRCCGWAIYFADCYMRNIQIKQKPENIFDGQLG